jgi:hypothetical protein
MKLSTLLSAAAVMGLAVTTAVPIQASTVMIQEQSQEVSSSSNASVTCTGECNGSASANSSASGRQWQRSEVKSGSITRSYKPTKKYTATAYIGWNNEGTIRLNWGMRGGTCHVRYTEANKSTYKYATSAGCDDGGVTIGGLTPGVRYRFQVRQNDGAWSRAVTAKAD